MMFDMVCFIILILIQGTQGILSFCTCLRRVIYRVVSSEKRPLLAQEVINILNFWFSLHICLKIEMKIEGHI